MNYLAAGGTAALMPVKRQLDLGLDQFEPEMEIVDYKIIESPTIDQVRLDTGSGSETAEIYQVKWKLDLEIFGIFLFFPKFFPLFSVLI